MSALQRRLSHHGYAEGLSASTGVNANWAVNLAGRLAQALAAAGIVAAGGATWRQGSDTRGHGFEEPAASSLQVGSFLHGARGSRQGPFTADGLNVAERFNGSKKSVGGVASPPGGSMKKQRARPQIDGEDPLPKKKKRSIFGKLFGKKKSKSEAVDAGGHDSSSGVGSSRWPMTSDDDDDYGRIDPYVEAVNPFAPSTGYAEKEATRGGPQRANEDAPSPPPPPSARMPPEVLAQIIGRNSDGSAPLRKKIPPPVPPKPPKLQKQTRAAKKENRGTKGVPQENVPPPPRPPPQPLYLQGSPAQNRPGTTEAKTAGGGAINPEELRQGAARLRKTNLLDNWPARDPAFGDPVQQSLRATFLKRRAAIEYNDDEDEEEGDDGGDEVSHTGNDVATGSISRAIGEPQVENKSAEVHRGDEDDAEWA